MVHRRCYVKGGSRCYSRPMADGPEGSADPLLGTVIGGKYRVLGVVGRGGYGTVYRAEQPALHRPVAIKVLDPAFATHDDPQVVQRFLREAAAAARLRHPNIVDVHDFGQEGGRPYLVMELLEGRTLNDVLKREGALPVVRTLHLAKQLCRALREAHKHGLVHRDVKPSNVLLVDRDEDPDFVKVLDFGLVLDASSAEELTREGRFVGTPRYMSPEHFGHGGADARSDIYSVGVLLYRMLGDAVPFDGTAVAILGGHLHRPPPPLSGHAAARAVPPDLEAAVMRCLAKRPEDRFQTIADLLHELHRIDGEVRGDGPSLSQASGTAPLQAPAAEPTSPARPGRLLWVWLLVPVFAGATALAVVYALRPSGPRVIVEPRPEPPISAPAPEPPPAELRLELDSTPPGATVWEGDERLGVTPLRLTRGLPPEAAASPRRLELRLAGHRTEQVTLVPRNGLLRARVELRRTPRPSPRQPAEPAGYKENPY